MSVRFSEGRIFLTKPCLSCNGVGAVTYDPLKGHYKKLQMCRLCQGSGVIFTDAYECRTEPQPEKQENRMNYSTAVMLINPHIRAIKGQYEEGATAEVFKTVDQDLKVGDFAVVESGTRWGLTVVKVSEVDVDVDFDSTRQVLWVVHVINKEDHDGLKSIEKQAIDVIKKGELRKRREEIRKNSLDAATAGEIDSLDIMKLAGGNVAIADQSEQPAKKE